MTNWICPNTCQRSARSSAETFCATDSVDVLAPNQSSFLDAAFTAEAAEETQRRFCAPYDVLCGLCGKNFCKSRPPAVGLLLISQHRQTGDNAILCLPVWRRLTESIRDSETSPTFSVRA